MLARLHTIDATPEQYEAGLLIVRDDLLPWARESSGFCGAIGLVDRDTGKSLLLTLWSDEEARTASAAAATSSPVNAGRYVDCCSALPKRASAVATPAGASSATASPTSPVALPNWRSSSTATAPATAVATAIGIGAWPVSSARPTPAIATWPSPSPRGLR